MDSAKQAITLMFERPSEPLIIPKGEKATRKFDLPDLFLNVRHRILKDKIKKRFEKKGEVSVVIENISIPDISKLRTLPKMENFSLFIPNHRDLAAELIDLFMAAKTVTDLVSLAAYCRDNLNPYLFNYSLSVALLHREDTKDIILPNFFHSFPGKFFDSKIFSLARNEAAIIPEDARDPIILPKDFTASDLEPEQRVAYFREDIGINLHHWHWHLVYPFNAKTQNIVDKDRRGELFYFMHQQIMARYNIERLCNGLGLTVSLSNLREPITEGYFPKLNQLNANRAWPPRFSNTYLRDVIRPSERFIVKIDDVEVMIRNVKEAIRKGYIFDRNASKINIDNEKGINILGNVIESTSLSPNKDLYGDLHNKGHVLISHCHDPDKRFLESFSVMGDTATSMRDPVFYRWHAFINDIFVSHKNKLPFYTAAQRDFLNVSMVEFKIQTPHKKSNEFHTFWEQCDVNMSRGIDFAPRGPIMIRSTHLQHEPFKFVGKIKNTSSNNLRGTARIYMAPQYNERSEMLNFDEQRKLMIELDKFVLDLVPGVNNFTRLSEESSVTISYDKTFRTIDVSSLEDPDEVKKFNFCGCGWPDHMLIPKGTTSGYAVKVFAMVSNYEDDKVVQDIAVGDLADAVSYCGLFKDKYPDKKPMGFPFDRPAKQGVQKLKNFLTPNMIETNALIIHRNETVVKQVPDRNFHVTTPNKSSSKISGLGRQIMKSIQNSIKNEES